MPLISSFYVFGCLSAKEVSFSLVWQRFPFLFRKVILFILHIRHRKLTLRVLIFSKIWIICRANFITSTPPFVSKLSVLSSRKLSLGFQGWTNGFRFGYVTYTWTRARLLLHIPSFVIESFTQVIKALWSRP